MIAAVSARRAPAVSVAAIAWTAAAAVFVLPRAAAAWNAPVGGLELDHLSGAWLASIGVADGRYAPTLFQALSALTLNWTDSETPARVLALAGALAVPFALYRLRGALGEAGAPFALLLLALDPFGVLREGTASAVAWDAAVALWLFAALVGERPTPPWAKSVLAFLVATAGPLPLPFLAAGALFHARRAGWRALAPVAAGAAVGLLATSLRFGLGADGVRVPSFSLFAQSFGAAGAANGAELAALYGLPLLVGGTAAALWLGIRLRREARHPAPAEAITAGAFGVAVLWFLLALGSASPLPLAAAALAASLLLGPALARLAAILRAARWREARTLLPLALGLAAVGCFQLAAWGRAGRPGGVDEQALAGASLALALALVAMLAARRRARPLALVPALVAGGVLLLAGAGGAALNASREPLTGAVRPAFVREAALDAAGGGLVVVHPRYREALTWPFRDSRVLLIASRVPPNAAAVVWPTDEPAPDGLVALEGRWIVEHAVHPPDDFLGWLHWLGDRGGARPGDELAAIYARPPE